MAMTARPKHDQSRPRVLTAQEVAGGGASTPKPAPTLTRIIATVGPASNSAERIRKLIHAGVSVFRLNFSHGDLADHDTAVETIHRVAEELGTMTAILGDLSGPKLRVGDVPGEGIHVPAGATVIIQRDPVDGGLDGDVFRFGCTHPTVVDDVEPGHRVLINDGAVRMLTVARHDGEIECSVTTGGVVSTGKGINLPDTALSLSPITERDWRCVDWAISHGLDFLALSFVRQAADIRELAAGVQQRAERLGVTDLVLPIVAKIELPQAVDHMDDIAQAADAIMVARGDLGVEMDLAMVPVLQRRLIRTAHAHGKPCIVATQMLESMITNASPTRAEVSDVAHAIFDDADAVMLSGETAVGRYPVLAVEMMRRVAENTEAAMASSRTTGTPPQKLREARDRMAALAHGVWTAANDFDARFVVIWSQSGAGARLLSQNNFAVPILAVSSEQRALRQMQLLHGVVPVRMNVPESLDHFTVMIDAYLLESGWAREGDPCVLVAGGPLGRSDVTNRFAMHEIGNEASGFRT